MEDPEPMVRNRLGELDVNKNMEIMLTRQEILVTDQQKLNDSDDRFDLDGMCNATVMNKKIQEQSPTESQGLESGAGAMADNDDVSSNQSSTDDNNRGNEDIKPVNRRRLSLREAPEFTKRLGSFQDSNAGDTVSLSCRFKAWPRPTITWYRDDNLVQETARHSFSNVMEDDENVATLTVRDVDPRDEGCYKCRVENEEGFASTTGYLSVSGKPVPSSSDRSRSPSPSSRLGGASPSRRGDRSSTPSGLRPIVEQKSMEEREAEECRRLGPSPIQEFIDVVRHKRRGLTKRARPLAFCPVDVYREDGSSFEYDDDDDSDVTGQETATDSDVTLSPCVTPTLTSSPELCAIWNTTTSPFHSPHLRQGKRQQEDQQVDASGKNVKDQQRPTGQSLESFASINSLNDSLLSLPDSQYESIRDLPSVEQNRQAGDGSVDQNSPLEKRQAVDLEGRGSQYVKALPLLQTTSQVVHEISDARLQLMRMTDDSDYDSDTTPISTPEVEIVDHKTQLLYHQHIGITKEKTSGNKHHQNNKEDIINKEKTSGNKGTPANLSCRNIKQSNAGVVSNVVTDSSAAEVCSSRPVIVAVAVAAEACSPIKAQGVHEQLADLVTQEDSTVRWGRSLQERRSRMFSDTMRRAASETRVEDLCRAMVTSPFKPLKVVITTAARKSSKSSNSVETSGIVLLSADKPNLVQQSSPGLQAPSSAQSSINQESTAQSIPSQSSNEVLNKSPAINQTDVDTAVNSAGANISKILNPRETKANIKFSTEENNNSEMTDTGKNREIRVTSRVLGRETNAKRRSRSLDITIRASARTLSTAKQTEILAKSNVAAEPDVAAKPLEMHSEAVQKSTVSVVPATNINTVASSIPADKTETFHQSNKPVPTVQPSPSTVLMISLENTAVTQKPFILAAPVTVGEQSKNSLESYQLNDTASHMKIEEHPLDNEQSVQSTLLDYPITIVPHVQSSPGEPTLLVSKLDQGIKDLSNKSDDVQPCIQTGSSESTMRSHSPCTSVRIESRQSPVVRGQVDSSLVQSRVSIPGTVRPISISTSAARHRSSTTQSPSTTLDKSKKSFVVDEVTLKQPTHLQSVEYNTSVSIERSLNNTLRAYPPHNDSTSCRQVPSLLELARCHIPRRADLISRTESAIVISPTSVNGESISQTSSKPTAATPQTSGQTTESHRDVNKEIDETYVNNILRDHSTHISIDGNNDRVRIVQEGNVDRVSVVLADTSTSQHIITQSADILQSLTSDQVDTLPPSVLQAIEPLNIIVNNKTLPVNVINTESQVTDDERIPVKQKNSLQTMVIDEISYRRELIDRVFESLDQVSIQFYLLFISVATALAAASAASGGGAVLSNLSPVMFVASGAIAVFISEVFRYVTLGACNYYVTGNT